jgi:Uri superfamily endonuclease
LELREVTVLVVGACALLAVVVASNGYDFWYVFVGIACGFLIGRLERHHAGAKRDEASLR